jgi:hypothetical protein
MRPGEAALAFFIGSAETRFGQKKRRKRESLRLFRLYF